jgi:molybdate transport system permease protein
MRTAVNIPVRGWRDRIFSAAAFFFVSVFIIFVLGLILTDVFYVDKKAIVTVLTSRFILHALWMSIWTSFVTTFIALVFAVPMGYALSRFRFPGRILAEAIVDLPIVFPPLVAGLTLLVFFSQTAVGRWIQDDLGLEFVFQPKGIVLCQFVAAASFAIRSSKRRHFNMGPRVRAIRTIDDLCRLVPGSNRSFEHDNLPRTIGR